MSNQRLHTEPSDKLIKITGVCEVVITGFCKQIFQKSSESTGFRVGTAKKEKIIFFTHRSDAIRRVFGMISGWNISYHHVAKRCEREN